MSEYQKKRRDVVTKVNIPNDQRERANAFYLRNEPSGDRSFLSAQVGSEFFFFLFEIGGLAVRT